jgi:hypothetical protein
MVAEVPVGREGNPANHTFVRLDPQVNPHVNFQITMLCESFLTNLTFKWLDSQMASHVDLQPARPRISLRAVAALERQLARVDQLVGLEVPSSYKHLVASSFAAHKGALASLYNITVLLTYMYP